MIDVLSARPASLVIELTSKCNLRCSYCHKSDEYLESLPAANADITDEMIGKLYRYCKEAGIKSVGLSMGGESTMHRGWHRQAAPFLDDPEIETHMVSNFVRLFDDDDLHAIVRIDRLQISIDSADFQMMRKLRSRADLRTITYNIIRLRQIGSEVGRLPFIKVNCTLCRDNIGHLARLASYCRELRLNELLITEMAIIGEHNPNMPQTLDHLTGSEVSLLAEQIAEAERALAGSDTILTLQPHLRARVEAGVAAIQQGQNTAPFSRPAVSSACLQPWDHPMVKANGDVPPCCSPLGGSVGNLGDAQSFEEIINGEQIRAVRASILAGNPIVSCQTCSLAWPMDFAGFRRHIERLHQEA